MIEFDVTALEWDCDGMDPVRNCGLPLEARVQLSEQAVPDVRSVTSLEELTDLLHEPISTALHNRHGFNLIGFTLRGLHQVEPIMTDAQRTAQWGTHPGHAQATGQVSQQLMRQAAAAAAPNPYTTGNQLQTPRPDWTAGRQAAPMGPLAAQRQQGRVISSEEITRAMGAMGAVGISPGNVIRGATIGSYAGGSAGSASIRGDTRVSGGNGGGSAGPGADPDTYSVGSVANFFNELQECKVKSVVLFYAPIVSLRGEIPTCPVCGSGNDCLKYQIVIQGDAKVASLDCTTCHLKVVGQSVGFLLHYGNRSTTIAYKELGKKPDAAFMTFAEELFCWRQEYRSGTRRKSRQSVIVEGEEEDDVSENAG